MQIVHNNKLPSSSDDENSLRVFLNAAINSLNAKWESVDDTCERIYTRLAYDGEWVKSPQQLHRIFFPFWYSRHVWAPFCVCSLISNKYVLDEDLQNHYIPDNVIRIFM